MSLERPSGSELAALAIVGWWRWLLLAVLLGAFLKYPWLLAFPLLVIAILLLWTAPKQKAPAVKSADTGRKADSLVQKVRGESEVQRWERERRERDRNQIEYKEKLAAAQARHEAASRQAAAQARRDAATDQGQVAGRTDAEPRPHAASADDAVGGKDTTNGAASGPSHSFDR